MILFFSIYSFVTGIVSVIYGWLILKKNYKNIINQTGFLLAIATAFWSFGYWQWLSAESKETALFWVRFMSIGSNFIPIFYFHWVVSLLKFNNQYKKSIIIFYLIVFFLTIFSFSEYFIKDVGPKNYFPFWPEPGFLYTLYLFLIYFGLVAYSLVILFKNYYQAESLKKEQIKYVFLGSIIGFGGGATNFFLWYNINIPPYGTLLVIFYPIIFSYAIVTHRLMNIRLAIKKWLISFFLGLIIFIIIIVTRLLTQEYLKQWSIFINAFIATLIIINYKKIIHFIYQFFNRFYNFYFYDPIEVAIRLSENMQKEIGRENIFQYVVTSLSQIFHARQIVFFIYNPQLKRYYAKSPYSEFGNEYFLIKKKYRLKLSNDDIALIKELKVVMKEELLNKKEEQLKYLKEKKLEVFAHFEIDNEIDGIIALAQKESGDIYNEDDCEILKVVTKKMSIIFKNTYLYDKANNLSVNLKRKVETAVNNLNCANKELARLDDDKSEFISLASHHLRTPLTAIRGFTSMILDGDYGQVSDNKRMALRTIHESSGRLIKLIEDILNISKIESGRMNFDFKPLNIDQLVLDVVEEFKVQIENKGLKLIVDKVKEKLPPVLADTESIRQVVINFIENAIKYTNKGWIKIKISRIKNDVEILVSDSGLGISDDDLHHLFQKFKRGKDLNIPGTGLGLYVARHIVEAHHGKIGAESDGKDRGSKFYFRLPIIK